MKNDHVDYRKSHNNRVGTQPVSLPLKNAQKT